MDDTQRTGWQKRILLFLTSQCITLFGSTLVPNGARLVCNHANIQRRVGGCIYSLFLSAAISHFIYRRRMGKPIPQEKIDYRRNVDCICHFRNGIGNSAYIHQTSLLGSLLVMSVIRSLGAGIQTPAVNAVIPQTLSRKISLCGTTASM